MSLAHWPISRLSSNRVAAASALRCCLPISTYFEAWSASAARPTRCS
jgi:hypothetical protein